MAEAPPPVTMLVMLSAMDAPDQRTFADYPEQFGRCTFSGKMGICKVVPVEHGPHRTYDTQELALAHQIQEVGMVLKTLHFIPADTTEADIASGMIGRANEEGKDPLDPATYEDAAAAHPTLETINVTPARMAAILASLPLIEEGEEEEPERPPT